MSTVYLYRVVLYPAIDILNGQVVRASRRGPSGATVYHPDPIEVAQAYESEGAEWIHVVDLDRAFGIGNQTNLIGALVRKLGIPVQIGGGLAQAEDVEEMRDLGVQRVLLHPRAAAFYQLLQSIADQFSGESLGLAIDVENGRLWARNWDDAGRWTARDLALRARGAGLSVVSFTELQREGALQGADIEAAAALAKDADMDVLISGGIDGLEDLKRAQNAGLAGAIVGRALFEKRFTVREALACCSSW